MELLGRKLFGDQQLRFPKQQEERETLLRSENSNQMAQREEVVVDFEGDHGRSKDEASASIFSSSCPSKKAEQKRKQDLQKQASNASIQRYSWKSAMSRTKSRLIDPPEESCESSEGANSNQNENDLVEDIPEAYKKMRFVAPTVLQWITLASIVAALVSNLWIPGLERIKLWNLALWEWEIMMLVLICGRFLSGWAIKVIVLFLERTFILRKRLLYFVYGLKCSAKNCIWLGMVLFVWHFIMSNRVAKKVSNQILSYTTKILVCLFVGTLIWLLKTLLVKVFALSFHVNSFFQRIWEALFNQYVIQTLSRPLLLPEAEDQQTSVGPSTFVKCSKFVRSFCKNKKQDEEISIDQLRRLNRTNISAWNMKRMINIIMQGSFTTLDEQILNSDIEDESLLQIRSEHQAKQAAERIFQNVAKTGPEYFLLEDVMKFMGKEEALKTMDLLGVASADKGISKSCLREWMVNAFRERRAVTLSLRDAKTAVDELHNMLNIVVAIIIFIMWLVILGSPILHVVVVVSSQLLLVVFMFGNTCRTVFEAIIFLFVMHPFDVGDRCEVDGVQMVVEEMNILTTVFLRFDNQKIIYPNNVLANKPISNYQRSPDMGDVVDFCIHISTPLDKVEAMKRKIIEYVERNNEKWHRDAMVIMRDVEELNKLNMSVWVTHTMNFQDMKERCRRRDQLIQNMIRVFRELDVEFRLLPFDLNVRHLPSLNSNRFPSTWTTCAT